MPYNPCPQAMDMACWGLVPRFWVKDKGFKEDDAVWGDAAQKSKPTDPPPEATELREGAFVATILCDDREEEMEENMEQVKSISLFFGNISRILFFDVVWQLGNYASKMCIQSHLGQNSVA